MRLLIVAIGIFCFSPQTFAQNNRIPKLIAKLKNHSDYKVRLSAAIALSKIGSKRTVRVFISALRDKNKTVRGVAVAALSKLVGREQNPRLIRQVIKSLERVSKKDSSKFVRREALAAIKKIKGRAQSNVITPKKLLYVSVGPMSAKEEENSEFKSTMRDVVFRKIKFHSKMVTKWPGRRAFPSAGDLRRKNMNGAYVDGAIVSIGVESENAEVRITCKVSMLIATFPARSVFGFLNGSASLLSSPKADDVKRAKVACIEAVAEQMTKDQVIPALLQKFGGAQ